MRGAWRVAASLSILASCASQARAQVEPVPAPATDSFPVLVGPYLGQKPPGTTAELFAPEIVRTGLNTRDIAITPDGTELYFSTNDDDHTYSTIYVTRIVDGTWTEPQIAPFATDTRYRFGEPFLSPEGARLYFVSTRPVDGSEVPNDYDLWFMERVGCPPESRGPRQLGPQ